MTVVVTPKTTPISTAPGFRSVMLDPHQLSKQPCLDHLRDMINNAYWNTHIGLICRENSGGYRFDSTDEVSTELGAHGRCCLVFRDEDEQMRRPVASAMIKHSNTKENAPPPNAVVGAVDGVVDCEIGGYEKEPEHVHDIEHWEMTAVAVSADDPSSLAGLGLAAHSCGQLERDVRERMRASKLKHDGPEVQRNGRSKTNGDAACVSDPSRCLPKITLWARATVRANPYWQRRGYDPVRLDVYPKGYWGAVEDIQVMILKKEVSSTVPVS